MKSQLILLDPMELSLSIDLGITYYSQGKLTEAKKIFQNILKQLPRHSKALNMLGLVLYKQGQVAKAIDLVKQALTSEPESLDCYLNLAEIYYDQHQTTEALHFFLKAIEISPTHFAALHKLGNIYAQSKQLDQAIYYYQLALNLTPNHPELLNNLGQALEMQGLFAQAQTYYLQSLAYHRDYITGYGNLGRVLMLMGNLAEGQQACLEGIALQPNALCYYTLANIKRLQGGLEEAKALLLQALAIDKHNAICYCELGNIYLTQSNIQEAIRCYKQSLAINKHQPEVHSNLIMACHYDLKQQHDQLLKETLLWAKIHSKPASIEAKFTAKAPGAVLRIGYVSGDFRQDEAAAYFIKPVIANHDHSRFEIFCYSNHPKHDKMTSFFKEHTNHWRDIHVLSDEAACEMIRADQIDILVELSNHSAYNRLVLFSMKPAPVQVTWVGFPGTTGIKEIDYIIATKYCIRPDEAQYYAEKPIYLEGALGCYEPDYDAPITGLPQLKNGYTTFGSFHNPCKINDQVLALWAEILLSCTNAKLLFLYHATFASLELQQQYLTFFAQHGIDHSCIIFCTADNMTDFYHTIERVDIILDAFPYNGGTTSLCGLWLGVPLITLEGERFAQRVGGTNLHSIGLAQYIAKSKQEYVNMALELAGDQAQLQHLRYSLRDKLKESHLIDGKKFTAEMERIYKNIWDKFQNS